MNPPNPPPEPAGGFLPNGDEAQVLAFLAASRSGQPGWSAPWGGVERIPIIAAEFQEVIRDMAADLGQLRADALATQLTDPTVSLADLGRRYDIGRGRIHKAAADGRPNRIW